MHSFTEENYLKIIFHLSADNEKLVQTNAIAEELNTKAASVTDMLKKLFDKSLIDYVKYQGVKLTASGKMAATAIVRKHRLWEVFLVEKLGFGWDEVHDIAEQLEHIDSLALIERLDRFLDFPRLDPHGEPIPDSSGTIEVLRSECLHELKVGSSAVIIGVGKHSSSFLQHLDRLGLTLGATLYILDSISYDGSTDVVIDNKKINIARAVAKNLFVNALEEKGKNEKH